MCRNGLVVHDELVTVQHGPPHILQGSSSVTLPPLDLQQLARQSNRTLFCHVPATLDDGARHLLKKMGLTPSDNNQYVWSPDRGA